MLRTAQRLMMAVARPSASAAAAVSLTYQVRISRRMPSDCHRAAAAAAVRSVPSTIASRS